MVGMPPPMDLLFIGSLQCNVHFFVELFCYVIIIIFFCFDLVEKSLGFDLFCNWRLVFIMLSYLFADLIWDLIAF